MLDGLQNVQFRVILISDWMKLKIFSSVKGYKYTIINVFFSHFVKVYLSEPFERRPSLSINFLLLLHFLTSRDNKEKTKPSPPVNYYQPKLPNEYKYSGCGRFPVRLTGDLWLDILQFYNQVNKVRVNVAIRH